jgi:hypothetical protein
MKFTVGNDRMRGTVIVPVGLTAVLILFSMIVGWNAVTVILYFFFVVPSLAIYLPRVVSEKRSLAFKSLMGLIIFYAFMVFMTYDHYASDYFQVMMIGFVVNIIAVSIIIYLKNSPGRMDSSQ